LKEVVANEKDYELPGERDEIAQLAYLYWQGRGCVDGHDVEDWLLAEQAILAHRDSTEKMQQHRARTAA
jgi:Protein of unknown function (DUF2934)